MFYKEQAWLHTRLQEAIRRPDSGLETIEVVALGGGIIAVIAGVVALMKGSLEEFWNSIDFGSVTP